LTAIDSEMVFCWHVNIKHLIYTCVLYVLYLMRMSVYIVVWESSVDENVTVFHKAQSRGWTHNNDQ